MYEVPGLCWPEQNWDLTSYQIPGPSLARRPLDQLFGWYIYEWHLPEAKLVHGDGKMAWLVVAVVQVFVVHRDQVYVTKDETVVLCVLQGFGVAHVQQFGSIESFFSKLE